MFKGTYTRTSAPASEPVTVAELKTHLKIDWTDEDTYLSALITAAREMCEAYSNLSFFTQTYTLDFDDFPSGKVSLYKGPIQSITSVTYYDVDNTQQTLSTSNYWADLKTLPGRLEFDDSPDTYDDRFNAVTVTMVTGWDDTADIPEVIKQAIKLQASYMYENREDANKKQGGGMCWVSEKLLNAYKVYDT